jgi:hypothetical protein
MYSCTDFTLKSALYHVGLDPRRAHVVWHDVKEFASVTVHPSCTSSHHTTYHDHVRALALACTAPESEPT